MIGQFRPKKLFSSIKAEVSAAEEWELPLFKEAGKHFLDKSLYALGLCSQIALSSSSSVLLSTEKHGERKSRRSKAMLFHKVKQNLSCSSCVLIAHLSLNLLLLFMFTRIFCF